ncbi:acyltransferase family protein [Bacillus cereus]
MGKIKYLDGIRGVAALIVVFSHIAQIFYISLITGIENTKHMPDGIENMIRSTPLNLIYNGNFSVFIFFVLSGYVLSMKFISTKNASHLLNSGLQRYPRLAIPVLFSILLVYSIYSTIDFHYTSIQSITMSDLVYEMVNNFSLQTAFTHGLFEVFWTGESQYNPVLWTIRSELFGSLLLFILLYVLHFFKNIWIRALGYFLAIYFGLTHNELPYVSFFIGSLICDFHLNYKVQLEKYLKYASYLLITVGLYFGSYPYGGVENTIYRFLYFQSDIKLFWFYHMVGAALVLVGVLYCKPVQQFFSYTCFVFLGKISFALYLIHFPILLSLTSWLFMSFIGHVSYNGSVFYATLITLPILLIASYLFYLLFDKSTIRFLKGLHIPFNIKSR